MKQRAMDEAGFGSKFKVLGKAILSSSLLEAFRLLTAVPLPSAGTEYEVRLRSSVAWFPMVGAAIGVFLVVVDLLVGRALVSPGTLLPSALVLTAYALVTGGLHHDALLDTADAFWGKRAREERLRIMRDSRAGALGVVALVLFLLVEYAALCGFSAVSGGEAGDLRRAALFSFPVLGRWSMSYLCVRFPPARAEGMGARVAGGKWWYRAVLSSAFTLTALVFSYAFLIPDPLLVPVLFLSTTIFSELLGSFFYRSLGGVTGDVIGATGMLNEALVLLLLASRVPRLHVGG